MNSDDGMMHTVSVYEKNELPHAILRLDLPDRELAENLMEIFTGKKGTLLPPQRSARLCAMPR